MKIAITGTIASGKSYLSEVIRRKGYQVYDADLEAKKCYLANHKGYKEIVALLGEEVLEGTTIVLSRVADKVFENRALLKQLEGIIHPVVHEEIEELAKLRDPFFAEVSVLFHTDLADFFDQIVVVTCDKEVAIERCIKDRGYSREEALRRYANQVAPEAQIERADKVIYNNGTLEEFEEAIDNWLKEIGC
ncbi:MAG: dephospho-CoA kinase [Erysipelotrichaceae bacterium]|nr:dephospho-CoA kinase [Erysipelotrichaceae bacterium]